MTIFTSDAIDNKHRTRSASTRFHRFAAGLGLACVILMQTGCVSLLYRDNSGEFRCGFVVVPGPDEPPTLGRVP